MAKFKNFLKIPDIRNFLKSIIQLLKYYLSGLWSRIDEHHLFLAGGGIAFSILLSMVPFILLSMSILGNLIDQASIEAQLTTAIKTIIPYPRYAEFTKDAIVKRIPEVIEYKTLTGYIGAIGLLFTSTWLFSSLRTVLNSIYGEGAHKGALHGLIRDFGMVILLVVFILVSTIFLPILNVLIDYAENVEFLAFMRLSDIADFILSFTSFLLMFLMFFIFYKLVPYAKLGKRVPLVSALWATILWAVAREIFGYYVKNFLTANKVYGAFVLIIVVLFWLFYSSCLFIIGAEIGQLYRERRQLKHEEKS